jgi:hypothetical protein
MRKISDFVWLSQGEFHTKLFNHWRKNISISSDHLRNQFLFSYEYHRVLYYLHLFWFFFFNFPTITDVIFVSLLTIWITIHGPPLTSSSSLKWISLQQKTRKLKLCRWRCYYNVKLSVGQKFLARLLIWTSILILMNP